VRALRQDWPQARRTQVLWRLQDDRVLLTRTPTCALEGAQARVPRCTRSRRVCSGGRQGGGRVTASRFGTSRVSRCRRCDLFECPKERCRLCLYGVAIRPTMNRCWPRCSVSVTFQEHDPPPFSSCSGASLDGRGTRCDSPCSAELSRKGGCFGCCGLLIGVRRRGFLAPFSSGSGCVLRAGIAPGDSFIFSVRFRDEKWAVFAAVS
jgi:hypothetical protein